jgi:hypothetical protein
VKTEPYKDEALLVAHLLGGRYGYDERQHEGTLEEQVAKAIRVSDEILRQLERRRVERGDESV